MKHFNVFTKKIIGSLGILLCAFFVQAQPNTLVVGKVNNAKFIKEIELSLNTLYLNNGVDVYTSRIIDDNTFAFAIEVKEPQIAILKYARNKGAIYVQPNDTLYIDCDANNFQYSFEFSGRLGSSNACLTEYLRMNPREMSIFNMTQYRQKLYWYQNSPKMDQAMLAMNQSGFENHMKKRKDKSLTHLAMYDANHPGKLTQEFKDFLKAEIQYDFAYHRLMYGHVFKNRYSLQESYFDFLEEVPLQNSQIGNDWYREFLVAYFDYKNLKSPTDERAPFIFQYEEGSKKLEGKTKAFFQSEIITRAFRAKEHEVIIDKYWDYMRHQDYGNFDLKVIGSYEKAIKFAEGTQAPDFVLKDLNNLEIALKNYRGKVVYLNFWATWCRPCMNKMEKLKLIQPELENEDVVFINVSLDRKEEVWKETLEEREFKGTHILASGELNSEIAKAYEIKVLPRYFIINKGGDFVKNPKSNDLEEVKNTLLDFAKK